MTTTHNETERAELSQFLKDNACGGSEFNSKMLRCAALLVADKPVDMVLYCPKCGMQHIDAPDERTSDWSNPPHKSHLCHGCWHIWRPSDTPTNGVERTASGKDADTGPVLAADKPAEGGGEAVCETGFPGRKIYKWFRRVPQGTLLYTHPQPQPVPDDVVKDAELSNAARDVITERRRQMEIEGWTPEHDDEHTTFAMATAAACYALHASAPGAENQYWTNARSKSSHVLWPWDFEWWKPSTPRRDLVKAAALILAEIERLDRSIIDAAMLKEGK